MISAHSLHPTRCECCPCSSTSKPLDSFLPSLPPKIFYKNYHLFYPNDTGVEFKNRMRYGYQQIPRPCLNPKGAIMASNRPIEGILMPMPVAFKHDGAIDHKATDAIIDFYLDAGVHGFFPLGTHGQGMVMEIDERKKVAEQIVQRVKGRVPVVMHIGTANTLSSIELAKHAVSLGVDAVGVVPPYYYPHDDWEVYAHYKAIAQSVPGTPMFIYDNTETTWVEITPA